MKNAARTAAAAVLLGLVALPTGPYGHAQQADEASARLAAPHSDRALPAALIESLDSDFAAAWPTAMIEINNPGLEAEYRSRLLRATIERARRHEHAGFAREAHPAFLQLSELLPSGSERSQLNQAWGNLMISDGRFAEAESLYRQALDESGRRALPEQANLYGAFGVALAQQGRLDASLDAMLQSYRLYDQTDQGASIDLLRNIGALSIYLKNWDQAVEFSQRALDKVGADSPSAPSIYSNLAAALIEQGKTEAALAALEKAMAIGDAHGQPNPSVISNLGYVLRELGRPDEALLHFERVADLNRAAGDTATLAIALKNIGETLIALGRHEAADRYLQQSLTAFREADIKPKRLELYPVLVDNLEHLGRYPEALAMMREYQELTREMASADAQARIAELQTAFDLERKERQLAESEHERMVQNARLAMLESQRSRDRMIRSGLVFGVLLLALFMFVLLHALRLRIRANRLLASKNRAIGRQREQLGKSNDRLYRQSIEDELTGLGNRRSISNLMHSSLPVLLNQPGLVILIDLDRFKGVNDHFGHATGDRVLARFADALRQVVGANDVLARWGGEEFLWIVAGTTIEGASGLCRALSREVAATRFESGERELSITCSMGVATVEFGSSDPQQALDLALKIADAALYEAKHNGRNRAVAFERHSDDPALFRDSLDVADLVRRGALLPRHLTGGGLPS